jgi:hypothetical protein
MSSRRERLARLREQIEEKKEEKEEQDLQEELEEIERLKLLAEQRTLVARQQNAKLREGNARLRAPQVPPPPPPRQRQRNRFGIVIRGLEPRAPPPVIIPPVPDERKEEESDEAPVVAEPLALSNKREQAWCGGKGQMLTWDANNYPLTGDTAGAIAAEVLRVASGVPKAQVRFTFTSSRSEESRIDTNNTFLTLEDMTKVLQSLAGRHVDGESGGTLLLTSVQVVGARGN